MNLKERLEQKYSKPNVIRKQPSRMYKFKEENIVKIPEVVALLNKNISKKEIVIITGVKLSTVYRINDCFKTGAIDKILREHVDT